MKSRKKIKSSSTHTVKTGKTTTKIWKTSEEEREKKKTRMLNETSWEKIFTAYFYAQ